MVTQGLEAPCVDRCLEICPLISELLTQLGDLFRKILRERTLVLLKLEVGQFKGKYTRLLDFSVESWCSVCGLEDRFPDSLMGL